MAIIVDDKGRLYHPVCSMFSMVEGGGVLGSFSGFHRERGKM